MGLLWLSTVPLTAGLVATMFGTKHMGSLYGLVFLSHQIGAFSGALLGGLIYAAYGNYDIVWLATVVLALLSAALHMGTACIFVLGGFANKDRLKSYGFLIPSK